MAYEKPNHTQIPNLFLDEHLSEIKSLSELKVTLAILRATIGFHRHEVRMDVPELIAATGLSRQSVIEGIKLAIENGRIKRRSIGHGFAYEGNIVTVKKVDSSGDRKSQEFCKEVDSCEEEALISLKKERKVGVSENSSPKTYRQTTERLPPKTPPPPYYDDAFLTELAAFTRYRKKLKKPLEEEAAVAFYADLAALGSSDRAIFEMRRAMAKGWSGIHPEKTPETRRLKPNGLPDVKMTTLAEIEAMLRPSQE